MILFVVYAVLVGGLFLLTWHRHRDVFHPTIVLAPQLTCLYALLPAHALLEDPRRFDGHVGGGFLDGYVLVCVILTLALLAGVAAGAADGRPNALRWQPLRVTNAKSVRALGALFGIMGLAGWLYVVGRSGGFYAAYGEAYGGGWADSGYVRELRLLGVAGAPLIFLARSGERLRPADWALIGLCLAPILTHGLVGARRGPTFVAIVMLVGGFVFYARKRVGLALLGPAAILVATLLLFLVANRGGIYLGSDLAELNDPLSGLAGWNANEFLIGSAVVRYTEAYGGFYGTREIAHLLGRLVPSALWPTVYEDLAAFFGLAVDLRLNAGVDPLGIYAVAGWQPSVGSATGFVGALWLEFQYLAPAAAFAIGLLYGATWRLARRRVTARLIYPILVALSVYLVMQDLDAWLFRLVLLGAPLALVGLAVRIDTASTGDPRSSQAAADTEPPARPPEGATAHAHAWGSA